ncbi:GNAT family N-acetyltransferase [Lysinibacillus pakistanensis]|uniref:GNAT family protein n=1 Tax=Lysinibacillus pakistanensis TaxID=759811 RepID=A0AAX3X0L7_9BACI|nr:GNAT family protein [Lysinibacillus pakistanensis]MDM5233199.1 GNAT family protein [Lysinibacillus pakistanensis]WHY48678.1 GNAT family protein [Lysinibacillus pakistanensis]WHY53691.1 GNAT family protein [Lysinibacillus pakistanensis]
MFLKSDILSLRKTELRDLGFVCSLESNEENAKFIIPWSKEKHEKAIENTDILHLIVEDSQWNHPVGYIIIAGLENPNLSLELVRITIGEKGKGYGKESFRLIKNWVFTNHNANRLWLDVKVNNMRAFHLYKKQGFVVEGTLRECLKNEKGFESLHIMSILKSEFENQDH